ncbi:ligand-binding sensor domain-containing protein [Proteiniphilum sp.]|uniref:ligand-binding sensor domain-containing protein n=1 Tax=Proteiniphilum sp. TaxID=1926877 RepID=UPI002B218E60|nr:two-component regulator propeller domain-containing protein [Proteiniphilum sp.]MEA4918698.1 two-component regulator propeller domain-containing protein [Proteiniphilum sp.]
MKKENSAYSLLFSSLVMVFFCASFQFSYAQKRYLFHTYNVKDGLINNTVYAINQDNKGYLWIATNGGISRFDGSQFDNTVISEVNSEKKASYYVDRSPSGKLAFATIMLGVMAEQDDGTYKQYLLREKQLGKNVVSNLKWLSDGKIITSESRSINIIEGDSVRQFYDHGKNGAVFSTLEYDLSGNIWFGGIEGVGLFFAGDTSKTPCFLPELKDIHVIKILFSDENKLLVGTFSDGYYEVDIQSAKKGALDYTVNQPFPELKVNQINHIYRDRQNSIWVSCVVDGVYQISNGRIIRHITKESGLSTSGAMCVFQDNENNYWFGTSDGICRLYSFSDFSYTHNGVQLTGIGLFKQDPFKRLWLEDGSILYFIEKDSVSSIPVSRTPFGQNDINAITFNGGRAYFFTYGGLFSMPVQEKIGWKELKMEIDFIKNKIEQVRCYQFEDDGSLLLACNRGLFAYRSDRFRQTEIISDTTLNLRTENMVKDKYGYWWLGDRRFGLHRFKPETDQDGNMALRHIQSYESLKPDSAFATAWIWDVMLDHKHNLWISSLYTGVYKLQIDETGVKNATLYSTANGLSGNDVYSIVEGKDHSIWFATQNGADRLVIDENGKEKIVHYNDRNGFGRFVYKILPDDSVTYISYEEGFFAVDNRLDKYYTDKPLSVIISAVSVMGKPDLAAMAAGGKTYRLPNNQNFIAFEFASVKLKDNEGIDYQYKLEGIDREWSQYLPRRYASYNSLPPGNYTFKVRAKMAHDDRDGDITEFRFRVVQPFYRAWWFIALLVAIVALIIYSIYIDRIKNIIKLHKMRVKIASDLHDDIGSTLSSISIMSDLLQLQLDNSQHAGNLLKKIGANAHNMLESMDDIVWSVNPANDKFQDLDLRVREYTIPLFESKNIRFQIITPPDLKTLPLSMDVRRNIFLIAKEAVNNLVKYSGCGMATIGFSFSHLVLTMKIEDDGKGFDVEQCESNNRNGLKNMKLRAGQIGAKLSVNSEIDKGTCIALSVKII